MPGKTVRMPHQTQTEIAVLQVQIKNVEEKVSELKEDLKTVNDSVSSYSVEVKTMIKEMQEAAEKAHASLSLKVSSLEKWRWMMMGAGIVIGSLGFETLAKMLK